MKSSSRPASAKSLTIKTKNLDYPDVGTVTKLYSDGANIKLSDGTMTYAFFTLVEREVIEKLPVKLQVGSVVHVAVQRDEAKKIINVLDDNGEKVQVNVFPVQIQEIQPVYSEKATVVEVDSHFIRIKLENSDVIETVVLSAAEKQMIQELNIRFAVGQVIHINIGPAISNFYPRRIGIKEIASPEPETTFLISSKPKVTDDELTPATEVTFSPNTSTVFSFLKEINSPVPIIKKREAVELNPLRAAAIKIKESAVVVKPIQELPAVDKPLEVKEKKLVRRVRIVSPNHLLPPIANPAASAFVPLPQTAVQMVFAPAPSAKRIAIPTHIAERKTALLSQTPTSSSIFPSVHAVTKPITITRINVKPKPVDNSELYQVLQDIMIALKPLATSNNDLLLMKNITAIMQLQVNVDTKIGLIITEMDGHNLLARSDNKLGLYAIARLTLPNTIAGFAKLAASINIEKSNEKLLSQLKLLIPGRGATISLPQMHKSISS